MFGGGGGVVLCGELCLGAGAMVAIVECLVVLALAVVRACVFFFVERSGGLLCGWCW